MRSAPVNKAVKNLSLAVAVLAALLFSLNRTTEAGSDSVSQEVPNLSGTWQLNEELSENPREKMPGSRGGGRGGVGGGRGGGGSFGGGGGRGGGSLGGGAGRSSGGPRGGAEGRSAEGPSAGSERITIDQSPEEISLTNGTGRTHTLYADGEEREEFLRGYVTHVVTRWEGAKLVSQFVQEAGQTLTRSYELLEDGRLRVTTHRAGNRNRNGRSFFQVYDRVEDSEELPAGGKTAEGGRVSDRPR